MKAKGSSSALHLLVLFIRFATNDGFRVFSAEHELSRRHSRFIAPRRSLVLVLHSQNNHGSANDNVDNANDNENDDDDDEEDEDESVSPYGNRSSAWTSRYRSLLPYEKARASVMQLGLRSKEEWDEYVADGKTHHGPYLPNHPDEMYALDWVSWEEFLGITRTHDESKALLRDVLKIQSEEDYTKFILMDSTRAAGLRLPFKPAIVYRNAGWISGNELNPQSV